MRSCFLGLFTLILTVSANAEECKSWISSWTPIDLATKTNFDETKKQYGIALSAQGLATRWKTCRDQSQSFARSLGINIDKQTFPMKIYGEQGNIKAKPALQTIIDKSQSIEIARVSSRITACYADAISNALKATGNVRFYELAETSGLCFDGVIRRPSASQQQSQNKAAQ